MNLFEAIEELQKETKPMFAHVKKAVENAEFTDSALIIREAGSGKTRIGTEIIRNNLNESTHAVWMCPSPLVQQAYEDLTGDGIPCIKFDNKTKEFPRGKVVIVSYDMEKSRVSLFTSVRWDVAIVDEFHRTRNKGTIINEGAWHIRKKAKKFYALTATPFNNKPEDFFELLSLVIGKNISQKMSRSVKIGKKTGLALLFSSLRKLITGKSEGNKTKAKVVLNKRSIEKILKKHIDYMEPEEYMGHLERPTPESSIERIEMTDEEVNTYDRIYRNKGMSNKEMAYRILLLRDGSSKVTKAAEEISGLLKKPDNRVLVFSNFVSSGLGSLSKALSSKNVKHQIYKGGLSKEEQDDVIDEFKAGKNRVLLISPSGFEGLNLKGTTHVIVLDPHYNPSKTTQLIARGLRAGSKTERVIIKHYCSVSKQIKIPTVDEKIMSSSSDKKEKNEALEGLIKNVKEKE